MFQKRNPNGMKIALSILLSMEVIETVKTGKHMVMAKVIKSAEERKGSLRNKTRSGIDGFSLLSLSESRFGAADILS